LIYYIDDIDDLIYYIDDIDDLMEQYVNKTNGTVKIYNNNNHKSIS